MLITNNNLYKIRDIIYDGVSKTSSCKVDVFDFNQTIVDVLTFIWKGDSYFLTEENLSNCNPLCLTYKTLKSELNEAVWYYSDDEDVCCIPKIYKYVKNNVTLKHFHDIDYTIELSIKLFAKRTFIKGELQSVIWYSDIDCTDAIINVAIVYVRDALGFAVSRTTTRSWVNMNDTLNSDTKITLKNYTINSLDQTEEGIRRRSNIIKGLQIPVIGSMLATINDLSDIEIIQLGRDFMKENKNSLQCFIDESHKGISTDIENATNFWLDNVINANGLTIRQYMLNELDISL